MPVDKDLWRKRKYKFWHRLWEDLEIGYLDEDLLPILIEFFLRPHTYTISSCSGRITLSDSLRPWSREETGIVFKKHTAVSLEEVVDVYRKPVVRNLWLNVVGPIIHVSADSLSEAIRILRISRNAGFKHSGILSFNKTKGIIIELRTGVRFTQLLKTPSNTVVPEDKLPTVVELANKILNDGKKKLETLLETLRRNRPKELDELIINELRKRKYRITIAEVS